MDKWDKKTIVYKTKNIIHPETRNAGICDSIMNLEDIMLSEVRYFRTNIVLLYDII